VGRFCREVGSCGGPTKRCVALCPA
jgi:hypothetical protein